VPEPGGTLGDPTETEFLNVDLDLQSQSGLAEVVKHLEGPMFVLHATANQATLELRMQQQDPEAAILLICAHLESAPPQARAAWDSCDVRRFDIGVQAGAAPHCARFVLGAAALVAAARLRSEVVFTVYGVGPQPVPDRGSPP
jgi:hypothetical protein